MKEERIALTKSQKALYDVWSEDYRRILRSVADLIQDNLNNRLTSLAVDLDIDLDGDWSFDHEKCEFVKKTLDEPKMIIPGEK